MTQYGGRDRDVVADDVDLMPEVIEIEAIEEPLRKKQKTSLQVKTTFVSGQTARVLPEERNLAPANGWMTKDQMESKLTFRVEPPDPAVIDLKEVTFNTRMKIQRWSAGNNQWEDVTYSNRYQIGHRSPVDNNNIRTQPDTPAVPDNPGPAAPAHVNGAVIAPENHARFSCPLPVIYNLEVNMNTVDKLNNPTPYDAFKEYFRWLMNTTDAEKRDEEMQRERNFYYDNRKVQWGNFATAEDRDCVGIYRTNAELDADNGALRKKFYNVLQMEEDLRLNGGVKRYTTTLPNGFFEKPGKHPGWQNFDVVITPADDSLLVVSRAADPEGQGNVNENVRVLYNMNETYLEYYYMQTKDGKNMETLIADNESFITAEQMYLMISEPIPHPFALPEGKLLDNITSEHNGFPEMGYFFFHPHAEMRGQGNYGTDAFGMKPWHITNVDIRQGEMSIWTERRSIPWRPYHYNAAGERVDDPEVRHMVFKMLCDADAPRSRRPREHRGSGDPRHLERGAYVGYFCVKPEDVGMNGYTEKQLVKPKVHINADVHANAAADAPPSQLVFVIAYSQPQKLVNTDNAANRWNPIKDLEEQLVATDRSHSRFMGNYERI